MPVRIFIVEDHPLMRRMTSEFIEGVPGLSVCGTASSAEEALDLLPEIASDLALVDVSLPGMSGIDLVGELQARWPSLRCLMLSGHSETTYVERALNAGAQGYVMKGDPDALAESIRHVLEGDVYLSSTVRERLQNNGARGTNRTSFTGV